MVNKKLLRLVGALVLVDGLLKLAFGRSYVHWWRVGPVTSPYRRAMERLAERPAWLLRIVGVAEASLGLVALAKAPLEVPELYHVAAPIYDWVNPIWRNWLYRDVHRALDRALATSLPPGGRVLDLGCGTGANLERLLALGLPFGSYTGVDLSEDMLARARAKFAHLASARFQQRDLVADPFPEGPFDLVISTWVFSHLTNPERVVQKALEQLRPGGRIVLLFLTATGSWLDGLMRPALELFCVRPLREDVYRRFPGLVSLNHFAGGTAALAILCKLEGQSA